MTETGEILVKVSRIHGLGVFAARHFKEGDRILEIDDSRVVTKENPLVKPESTEGGRRVSVLRRQEGAPVLLG